MKFFHQSLAKKQVWRQIKRFGGRFGGRDVGFKKRVAILGPVNFRSMVMNVNEVLRRNYGRHLETTFSVTSFVSNRYYRICPLLSIRSSMPPLCTPRGILTTVESKIIRALAIFLCFNCQCLSFHAFYKQHKP